MRKYCQFTEDNRIEIYAMKQAGKEQKIITVVLRQYQPGVAGITLTLRRVVDQINLNCVFFGNIYKKLGINRADRYGIGVRISAAQARIDLDFAIEKLVEVTHEPDI